MPKVMEIATPLGEDLLFHGMTGTEEMSRLFAFHVSLLSRKDNIPLKDIVGQNVTVKLALNDDSTRYFNGYVARFSQGPQYGRYTSYFAEVVPWLWFLTRTADCRIFQSMTVPDIIKKVFADTGAADFKLDLTATYRKWDYCVQYRETDFNFVSRLMEHEGIGYYFKHSDGKNTMVLTDTATKHTAAATCETLPYIGPEEHVQPDREHISDWRYTQNIHSGLYVHDDYNFEMPSNEFKTSKVVSRPYAPSKLEVYDYPGTYMKLPDGEQYAEVRIEELGNQYELATGQTNARNLTTGSLLTLENHKRIDQNREYLIVSASYFLNFNDYEAMHNAGETEFKSTFSAQPTTQQFRPRRATPKPFVQGPQTAVVVGPPGEEIHTDKYGRVKVQFHWDRLGQKDDNSSCWIRVSHPWAGKAWGAIATPRIGQEVIVDFLEGDPDQPIVTGRVYNAEQMPPYDLPANKTQSGVKSRSSLNGTAANFNELRFEDKKGSELVTLHAEKDQSISVENDESHTVGHDRTKTIDHDETSHIKHDRTETVDNNETITIHGQRTETVDKDETITIHMNRTETVDANETISIGGNRTITVSKSETATVALQRTHSVGINETITVGAAQEITIGGLQAVTVGAVQTISVGANQSTSVGRNQSNNVGGNRSVTVAGNQTTKVTKNESTSVTGDEARSVNGGRTTKVNKDDALNVTKNRTAQIGENDTHKAGKVITVDAGDKLVLKAANEIKLTVGQASMVMKKNGNIEISGMKIEMKGSQSVKQEAAQITSEASAVNTIKGGIVKIN